MTAAETDTGIQVGAGDVRLLRIGTGLVKGAAKNAFRLNTALDLDKAGGALEREAQAEALEGLLDSREDENAVFTVPSHLTRCARIGIALELGKVNKVKEEQETLVIEDTKGCDKRVAQLERLLNLLDGQTELPISED
jgi:hypothetical protein